MALVWVFKKLIIYSFISLFLLAYYDAYRTIFKNERFAHINLDINIEKFILMPRYFTTTSLLILHYKNFTIAIAAAMIEGGKLFIFKQLTLKKFLEVVFFILIGFPRLIYKLFFFIYQYDLDTPFDNFLYSLTNEYGKKKIIRIRGKWVII